MWSSKAFWEGSISGAGEAGSSGGVMGEPMLEEDEVSGLGGGGATFVRRYWIGLLLMIVAAASAWSNIARKAFATGFLGRY